jgi:acyl-CoA thioester hydrolase
MSEHGWMEGRVHVWPLRIYYADTDAAGVVYHSNYLKFAEQARTECMRCLGVGYPPFGHEGGLAWAVRHVTMDFQKPALLDDRIVVLSEVLAIGGASSLCRQTVARVEAEGRREPLVVIDVKAICIDNSFRAARLPADVRRALTDRMLVTETEPRDNG